MLDRSASAEQDQSASRQDHLWTAVVVFGAFCFYAVGAAPGLTWAHQGADGGELITAAVVNGVPHPPGYPLYILLLQAWLWPARSFGWVSDLNRQAALFSALCAALSVGVTLRTARHLLQARGPQLSSPLLWATLAAAAWAIAPLVWTQAVIPEVYALHALLSALLGWAVLVHPTRLWYVTLIVALGVANHLTTLLLLPAAAYALWTARRRASPSPEAETARIAAVLGAGLLLGALFYVRIPLVAGSAPPVNWGYADNWSGFWWLVSGDAYRGYLFDGWPSLLPSRLADWAYTVTVQYTPVGLALALLGLAYWDRTAGDLRTFSLLWLLPVSGYALAYNTRDSDIYLLPVTWVMALWLAVGLAQVGTWVAHQLPQRTLRSISVGVALMAAVTAVGLAGLAAWRWPQTALASDHEARDYLAAVTSVLEPHSIVVTQEDRETFAVWYGVWGSRELAEQIPDLVPVNNSLYQFDWYRRLQGELHPQIAGIDESVDALIAANRGVRPIYFAQLPLEFAESELTPVGPLWRLSE